MESNATPRGGGRPSSWNGRDVPSIFASNQSAPPLRVNAPRFTRNNSGHTSVNHSHKPRSLSGSTSSELAEAISPDPTDRVFPIRSVVSIDPTSTSQPRPDRGDYFASKARRESRSSSVTTTPPGDQSCAPTTGGWGNFKDHTGTPGAQAVGTPSETGTSRKGSANAGNQAYQIGSSGQGYHIHADMASPRSDSVSSTAGTKGAGGSIMSRRSTKDVDDSGPLITARFKHVVSEGGHAVITGRDGETLQKCEDEPIHIPGAVQSFGLLIALKEEEDGRLVVRVVSENSKRIIGYTPRQLFALESFTDIFSEEQADNLMDHVDFVKDDGTDVQANGPEVFTLSVRTRQHKAQKLWCAIHINEKHPELIICEFELEDDPEFPLIPAYDRDFEAPEDTLNSAPTEDELKESTEVSSRPLRVLRSARKQRGEAAAMEVFNIMSQVQEQLAEAPNLDRFLKVLVGVVKELTGFHRVMIYQFDQTWNGKVVTELVDTRATKDLYKGLHFPASDIPKQARDMYVINRVRLLYDRSLETARLVCRTVEDLEKPLDMTHAYLRAMSPIHVKYLENMAVRSSMSISINAFNELWGLISCHTYGPKGTRVSFPIRKMCRLVGDSASRNIERLSYASRLQARRLVNTSSTSRNPTGYIIASSEDLLRLFDADFGLLSIYGETKILGKLEGTQEALALLEYLRLRHFTSVMTSNDVLFDFPDMRYQPGFSVIAGLLLVPLSGGGNDFIVFFRKGQLKEVKWAGNPYEKFIKEGTEGYLEPRKSFKTWTETVVGRCREWTEEEVETAAVLCLVYGKFIEVWRQKEAALENTQLTKLLLANSAHEVRTPLNAIINYLEIAMEGSLDQETRDNLSRSHSASKSLIYVINDLLDLTKTEQSTQLIQEDAFDFRTTFRDAVDMFAGDAKRKQIAWEVIEHPSLPERVLGDQRRVRQAISNVTANAIQATSNGGVKVEVMVVARDVDRVEIEVVVEDTGVGMTAQQLDDLFAELEQAQSESGGSALEKAIVTEETSNNSVDKGGKKATSLGLGLAVVARIVRNMDGQLRVKSEEGKGSRFVIQFPFEIPASDARQALMPSESAESLTGGAATEVPTESTVVEGELLLVDKGTPRCGSIAGSEPSLSRKNSNSSITSLTSKRSVNSLLSGRSISSAQSGKTDADRLIEAMQEPAITGSINGGSSRGGSRSRYSLSSNSTTNSTSSPSRRRSLESNNANVPAHLRSARPSAPGEKDLTDSGMPLRALKMPDDEMGVRTGNNQALNQSRRIEEIHGVEGVPASTKLDVDNLRVLVAEDDPINSKIVKKRMEKLGHEPWLTVNGEECASLHGERPGFFDVILMDMQMPIVDGLTSTKMIRSFEKSSPSHVLSARASLNHRIPIIAVSASLIEKERHIYIDAGFDGWILKPISFARLNEILKGIVDKKIRGENVYRHGKWDDGGWFAEAQPDVYAANTKPDTDHMPPSGASKAAREAAESENTADPAGFSPHQQQARAAGQEIKPVVDDSSKVE